MARAPNDMLSGANSTRSAETRPLELRLGLLPVLELEPEQEQVHGQAEPAKREAAGRTDHVHIVAEQRNAPQNTTAKKVHGRPTANVAMALKKPS